MQWRKVGRNVFSSFIVCKNRNRSAQVRELLSNNSLCVGQLYEDKPLALRVIDLIFFTTDLQTENYYSTIHCRSYFLNIVNSVGNFKLPFCIKSRLTRY